MRCINRGASFVRYEFGDLVIIALRDGYVDMPPSRLRENGRPLDAERLKPVTLVDGQLRLAVNAFLVIEGVRHTLIDTGAGDAWLPTMGLLHRALAEAEVAREAIRTVALTHTHLDHVNGSVTPDGKEAFPNLECIFVPPNEMANFDDNPRLARFRKLCVSCENGHALSDCVTAVSAIGHSTGHTAFEISSGGEKLLIWGDIVHVPSIQFTSPELTWEFDEDQAQARVTRLQLLDHTARTGSYVAGAHLDFPGVGHVSKLGDAFEFRSV